MTLREHLHRPLVGIVPAAGNGSRMRHVRHPKELLPLLMRVTPGTHGFQLAPIIEHALEALRIARAHHAWVVVSEDRAHLVRTLGDGSTTGVPIAYLVQAHPQGLADAVDRTYVWTRAMGADACLVLPDSLFRPVDALARVVDELSRSRCDLCLGVFPTSTPEALAPVKSRADGGVEAVFEKPVTTPLSNTWGVAAWGPRYADFLHEAVARGPVCLSESFHAAASSGLNVRAVHFADGSYDDLGTSAGIAAAMRRMFEEVGACTPEGAPHG